MDAFMDKLAEKLNAEEIIQANRSADLNQKFQEKQDEEFAVLQVQFQKLQKDMLLLQGEMDKLHKAMETLGVSTNEFIHKENVKVYRNVQAVVVDEAAKQEESIRALTEVVESMRKEAGEAAAVKKTPGIQKGILAVAIVTMLLAAGSVAFQLLTGLGILTI